MAELVLIVFVLSLKAYDLKTVILINKTFEVMYFEQSNTLS